MRSCSVRHSCPTSAVTCGRVWHGVVANFWSRSAQGCREAPSLLMERHPSEGAPAVRHAYITLRIHDQPVPDLPP